METVQNAFLAPFSADAASKTTHAKVAIAYVAVGFLVGMMLK